MASIKATLNLKAPVPFVKPQEVYRGAYLPRQSLQVQLRIASDSGPGSSGLIKALVNGFIMYMADEKDAEPFSVSWVASDAGASFDLLATRSTDLIFTNHVVAGNIAIKQGVADRSVYVWRDHWLLVGPKSNPADLSTEIRSSVHDQFAQIFLAAVETSGSVRPVKFLSRHDKSAANIMESSFWVAIDQAPWANPQSTWYHQYPESPLVALQTAATLGQYTLTDEGTWFALDEKIREGMSVFAAGGDAEDDVLLNPAHVLVGKHAQNKQMADLFADWLVNPSGGQRVIDDFLVDGEKLYVRAPTAKAQYAMPFTPPQTPSRFGGK